MVQSNVCPSRMAPPCKNPMKTHMQRRSWLTDRHHTHCPDPVTWATVTTRRHKVVHQRGTIAQTTAQKRKQNHANTRAQHKTSSKRKETVHCRMSVNASPLQRTWHDGRYLLLSSVATHIDKDHQRQHVMGTAQDADKEPTPANTNCRRRVRGEKTTTQKVSPSNDVRTQNKTHMAHDTATQKKQPYFALRHVTSRYCTEPYTQTLSVQ